MNPAEARTSNKLYAKIFLSFCVCIVLTIATLSLALYASFEKIALSNIYASEKSSLAQTSYGAKSMIDYSTNYALQIYADPQLDKLLHYASPGTVMETNTALSRLNTYLNVNYSFHSIYIYSRNSKTFYTASKSSVNAVQAYSDFYDADARSLVERFGDYKRLAPIPRILPVPTPIKDSKTANVYTFVFYDLQGASRDIDNMVMLNVPESWMKDAIASLDRNQNGSTFVVDGKGTLVTSTETFPFLENLSGKPYVKQALSGSSAYETGYFVGDVEGARSLVVYSKHEATGWIFMRVLPYDTIMGKIDTMKKTVLIVCFIILLLGVSVSFFLSKSLYKPIEKVLARLNALMKEKRNNDYQLRQNFMRQLLRYGGHRWQPNLESEMKTLDIAFDPAGDFVVVLLVIDRFDAFAGRYPFNDRVLLKYGVMNIASECFAAMGGARECVDMDEKTIAVLANGGALAESSVHEAVRRVQDATERYLRLSLSASVSRVGDGLAEVSDLYEEAHLQWEFKFTEGYRCLLHGRRHRPQATAAFIYPATLEHNMLETLKLGKAEEARKRFDEIVRCVDPPVYLVYNMLFNQLAFSISSATAYMDKGSGAAADYDFGAFVQRMHLLETLQDVRDHFGELIDQLCQGFREKKNNAKHDNLIASIDDIIRQQYADRELSLYKIAEMLDMSPAYLGRIFKKLTLKSVPDYLNEYRVERAKELLVATPHSIEEISQKTGYNNSTYFYKVFKKYTGLTPAEYRQVGN
ncbi:AraC family transcriptional regulator [Cohnella sp. GbtcB17]|uniref:AraC family transcriptional regulator n=1 Tax=Cohnella sp. GbtcB17 TaxID=2824762 RepID=UPI001C3038A9|nr:helix-turn-helix domain-containing protein [Cohnella sp. GbtcB17]